MRRKLLPFIVLGTLCLLVGLSGTPVFALTFTCEPIARSRLNDPEGAPFGNRFGKARRGGPMINGSGDVVFFAKPRGAPRRLYLYPGAGAAIVIAEDGDAAPAGGSFRQFENPSINDAGEVGFFGDLDVGEGVFIRQAGGTMVKVAQSGDPAPGGGTIATIEQVSRINEAGDIAFIAAVDGAPNGVFSYDAGSATVSSVARDGDAALDGRELCEFIAVGLGGSGAVAVQVSTQLDCTAAENDLIGVYRQVGIALDRVALEDDPTPIAGTTFTRFYGPPDSNASDEVLFRARGGGASSFTALFLFDPVGPATVKVVATGDAVPLGGTIRTIVHPGLTDDGRAGVRVRSNDISKHGVYVFDGTDDIVARKTDPVPTGTLMIAPASYRKIFEEVGIDRSGTRVTYSAKVRQNARPGGVVALFRCAGS